MRQRTIAAAAKTIILDMDLLLACKEEFHRRLRIYNAWKSRNQSVTERESSAPRAPNAVYANAQSRWNTFFSA